MMRRGGKGRHESGFGLSRLVSPLVRRYRRIKYSVAKPSSLAVTGFGGGRMTTLRALSALNR